MTDQGILVDYHTHPMRTTEQLPVAAHREHFRASMASYAERAAELGLAELGFSEHIYRLSLAPGVVPWKQNLKGDIGAYVEAVLDVRQAFPSPVIRLSMEVDIVPSTVSILQAALPLYPFDYILGSVHQVPDLAEDASPLETYRGFYATIQWAARSGLFHSIAHPDRVHRRWTPIGDEALHQLMAETAAVLASHGVCVEASSNGVRSAASGLDPHPSFLRLCRQHGVAVTLGSDAHKLDVLGEGLPELRDMLWGAGYRELATYERGRRTMRPLPPPAAVATPIPTGARVTA